MLKLNLNEWIVNGKENCNQWRKSSPNYPKWLKTFSHAWSHIQPEHLIKKWNEKIYLLLEILEIINKGWSFTIAQQYILLLKYYSF